MHFSRFLENNGAKLRIWTCEIDCTALANFIRHAPAITRIVIANCRLDDEGAKAIAKTLTNCENLVTLFLRDNQIGDEGAAALARALPCCKHLAELNLGGNEIGDEGARALAAVLERTSITSLYLSRNNIGDESAAALFQVLQKSPSITYIGLLWNKISDELLRLMDKQIEINQYNKLQRSLSLQLRCAQVANDNGLDLSESNGIPTIVKLNIEHDLKCLRIS